MTLQVDPSSADYNSYLSRVDADARIVGLEPFVNIKKWTKLTGPQKDSVVLKATDEANSFDFVGATSNLIISANNMMWPRSGVSYANGVQIQSSEVPEFVKEYIAQRCMEVLEFGPSDANKLTVPNNVKRKKIGSLEKEFFSPDQISSNTLSLRDFSSYGMLVPYVIRNGNLINLERA